MKNIPKYLKLLEENLYACEICHSFLSTDHMIKFHKNDDYHKEKIFELRQKVRKYEEDNLLKKRSEFKNNKNIYISEKKQKIQNNKIKIGIESNLEGIFQKNQEKEIKIKKDFEINNTNEINLPFQDEYTSLIKNQEQNLYSKKRNLIKERLNLLRQKKLKKNN